MVLFFCAGEGNLRFLNPQSAALKQLADAPRFAPNVRIADKVTMFVIY